MKYYVTMIRMIESTALVEVDAESEDDAVNKAEAIYMNDTNDTEIKWSDDGIEGVSYEVEDYSWIKL